VPGFAGVSLWTQETVTDCESICGQFRMWLSLV